LRDLVQMSSVRGRKERADGRGERSHPTARASKEAYSALRLWEIESVTEAVSKRTERRLTIDTKRLIRVLNQLVHRQRRIVRFHHRIRHLGARDDRESGHHPVGELFANLRDEEGAHAGTGTAAEGVGDLRVRSRGLSGERAKADGKAKERGRTWKPCKQSHPSASLRTTSITWSTSSAPSV
jgi:hypothetical protein